MFEHLTNGFEVYRNKVIEINKRAYDLEHPTWYLDEGQKKERLKLYLKVQEELNNLYRIRVSY